MNNELYEVVVVEEEVVVVEEVLDYECSWCMYRGGDEVDVCNHLEKECTGYDEYMVDRGL